MKKHSLKDWMIALRPWSFPASSMPVVVTLAYLYWIRRDINWVNGIWALLNIVVFHAAGNTWSDYFDYKQRGRCKGYLWRQDLDRRDVCSCEIYGLSMALLAVALVAGVGLLWRTGLPLLYIGIGGAACFVALSAAPVSCVGRYRHLWRMPFAADVGHLLCGYGVVDWNVLWIALPVGLITVAILHANKHGICENRCPCRDSDTGHEAGGKASMCTFLLCRKSFFSFGWIAG